MHRHSGFSTYSEVDSCILLAKVKTFMKLIFFSITCKKSNIDELTTSFDAFVCIFPNLMGYSTPIQFI